MGPPAHKAILLPFVASIASVRISAHLGRSLGRRVTWATVISYGE